MKVYSRGCNECERGGLYFSTMFFFPHNAFGTETENRQAHTTKYKLHKVTELTWIHGGNWA